MLSSQTFHCLMTRSMQTCKVIYYGGIRYPVTTLLYSPIRTLSRSVNQLEYLQGHFSFRVTNVLFVHTLVPVAVVP